MEQTSEKERLGVFDKMPDPAHLLSTVRECGRIVLLKGGKIAEEGTFDELTALDGVFR